MAKTLEQMFNDTMETSAKVGARVNAHSDRKAAEIQETTAKVGARVNARVDRRAAEIQETTAKVGKRVMDRSDENHSETRRVIRDENERTRRALRDYMEWPEILIGLICGIIAGIGMWVAEKSVILKPVAWDKAGNVIKYGPDTFLVVVLAIVLGAFVFFCISWLVHAIRNSNRR